MSSDINIGQITEALNDKMDRDGVNAAIMLPKVVLLYDGNISKGNTITLSDDASNYNALYAINNNLCFIGYYHSGNKIKLWSDWVGVDSLNGGAYQQFYVIDLGDRNGNSYVVWNYSWMAVGTTQLNQLSNNVKIYGIKFRGAT